MRKTTAKNLLAPAAIIAAAALVMSGCAADTGGTDGSEITIGMIAGLTPQFEEVAAAYEEANPGVTISFQSLPDEIPDMTKSLQTGKLGGQLPDIVIAFAENLNQLAAAGVTTDISAYMEESELTAEDFLPNYLDLYRPAEASDEIHGLPVGADALVLAYNADVFEQAGVDLPTDDWTWADMDAAADALSAAGAGEYFGMANGPENALIHDPILKAFGAKVYDPATNTSDIGGPEAVEAWTLLTDEWLSGRAAPYTVNRNERPRFQDGRIAMILTVRPAVPSVNAALDNWDVVDVPELNGVTPTGGSSYALAITEDARNGAAAWDFLQFLYAEDGGMALLQATGQVVPATVEGVESGAWQQLERPANQAPFGRAALEATMITQFPPAVQGVYDDAIAEAIERIVLQGTSVAEAFADAEDAVNQALAEEAN